MEKNDLYTQIPNNKSEEMVPSWGYQLFYSGYKLMADGRFFFPPWNSDECEDLLFNVQIILGLSPLSFRTPMVTSWKVTVWGNRSVFKVFQGPSFSLFLFSSWVVQNHTENCYRRLQRWPAPLCSGNWLFPVFILSSQSCNYHFQRCLAFPQNRQASGMWSFQSALLHHCF